MVCTATHSPLPLPSTLSEIHHMNRKVLSLTAVAAVVGASFAPSPAPRTAPPLHRACGTFCDGRLPLSRPQRRQQAGLRSRRLPHGERPARVAPTAPIQAGISIDGHLALDRRREEGRADLHRCGRGQGPLHHRPQRHIASARAPEVGRSYTVRIFTRDGQHITKKMVLRAERKGDDTGKPLSSRY